MGQTVVEKIAQRHMTEGPDRPLRTGDVVSLRPRHVMTHDNTAPVMKKFLAIGATKIHDPKQPVFALDHDIQKIGGIALVDEFKLGGKSLQIGGCHHFGETVITHVPEQPQFPDLWQIGRSHGFLRLIIVKISIVEPSKQSTAPQSCGLINVCAVIERRSALPCFYIALLIS